jgi:hypothetical protein
VEVRFAPDSPLEEGGFEPSVPLLRKALLGIPNRDASFRFDIAMIAWLGFPRPFGSRWDHEFESAFLQQRVKQTSRRWLVGAVVLLCRPSGTTLDIEKGIRTAGPTYRRSRLSKYFFAAPSCTV